MSEMQLRPLPKTIDYTAAVELSDEDINAIGGARSFIIDFEQYAARSSSEIAFRHVMETGLIALELEPKKENGVATDRSMPITHAFKRGMLLGFKVQNHLHGEYILPGHVREAMRKGFAMEELEEKGSFKNDPPLMEWGQQGLDLIGEQAVDIMTKWSDTIYRNDEALSRICILGSSAVLYTAHAIAIQDSMSKIDTIIDNVDWEGELEEVAKANTGD